MSQYVIFNTLAEAQAALAADNTTWGYPNTFGTQNAWGWFEHNGKYVVIADPVFLVGYSRSSELP